MGHGSSNNKGPIKNVEKQVNGEVNGLTVESKPDHNGSTGENAKTPNGEVVTVESVKSVETVETDSCSVEAQQPEVAATSEEVNTPQPKGDGAAEGPTPSQPPREPADIATKQDPGTSEEPESVSLDLEPAEGQEEHLSKTNPVMNFFKTLVNPTKTQKKETATPDVTKDQPPTETPPTVTSTTVAQVPEPPAAPKGMSIPPPPPPEPPKMEMKGEPAVRPQKPTAKEGAKASAKQPEASKSKSLGGFFRSKATEEVSPPVTPVQVQTVEEVVPEPVVVEEEKVDVSKTTTLEADVKPETATATPEEKKPPAKSGFLSFFKPKGQKRNSLDSGVQTEAPAAGSASEKTK